MKKTPKQTRSSEKKLTKTALKTAVKKAEPVKKMSKSSAKAATKKASAPIESGTKKTAKAAVKKKPAAKKATSQKTVQKAAQPTKVAAKKTTQKTVKAPTKKATVKPVKETAKKPAVKKAAKAGKTATKTASVKKTAPAKTTKAAKTSKATPRAVRKRAPKDLADQYGQQQEKVRAAVPSQKPRKRRSATVMAKLREAIAPDEEILQRLTRAGMISSKLAPEHAPRIGKSLSTRRSRKWKMHCGKCDTQAEYTASAALCAGCGTILVRSD